MDNLNFNKIAAGVLCGGLLLMAGIKAGEILLPHQDLEENAYPFEVAEATGDAHSSTQVVQDAGPEPILDLLASADIAAGQALSKKCTACHVFDAGGPNKVGPNLYNIVSRDVASVADFKYSGALTDHGGAWSYEELNGFLYKPKTWVSGTKMNFAGLKKPQDRANIIAWMRTLSDDPTPLP
jgi:cytochrome c